MQNAPSHGRRFFAPPTLPCRARDRGKRPYHRQAMDRVWYVVGRGIRPDQRECNEATTASQPPLTPLPVFSRLGVYAEPG